jgi:cytochrome c553
VLVKQLVDFQHGRRWDFRMEHFADRHHLPDAQAVADVAAYVTQLEDPASPGVEVGPGQLVEDGAGLYARLCASCHGPSGQGDAKHEVPQIAGQHYEYLRRQIYNAVDGRRPNFPAAHIRLFARLEHDDIVGVADYLSRLDPKIVGAGIMPVDSK